MPNDMLRFTMEKAAQRFGGGDGTFNAANFSNALRETSGVAQTLDGKMVRALMVGRPDVRVLPGSHYRLKA
jgi:hypothetical protein